MSEEGYRIITISREFGSGGRHIGKEVADRLGIGYYDKELIEKVAEETGLSPHYIERKGEYAPSKSSVSYAFVGRTRAGKSLDDMLYNAQEQIIKNIADEEPCVIIGRCADYILRNRKDCLNIFICGHTEEKIERIMKLYNNTPQEAKKLMKEMDKKRSINYNFYTDRKWGRPENYALTINSSILGYDKAIEMIADIYRHQK